MGCPDVVQEGRLKVAEPDGFSRRAGPARPHEVDVGSVNERWCRLTNKQRIECLRVSIMKRKAEATGGEPAGDHLCVMQQWDFVDVARPARDREFVPSDRRVANAIGPDISFLAVDWQDRHIELQRQTG